MFNPLSAPCVCVCVCACLVYEARCGSVPCDQLDKVLIEGNASTSIKDGGADITVEICGHHLQEEATGKCVHISSYSENVFSLHQRICSGTYLVLCVSQNSLHGSFRGGLDHFLDVIVFGLTSK